MGNLFHLNEMAAEANLLDYQHRVEQTIERHAADPGFPQMDAYGVTREALDSYLFDCQAILDAGGSARSRYTVCGVLIVLPVIVLSAIPEQQRPLGEWAILWAVGVGLLLFGVYLCALRLVATARRRRLDRDEPACARYVADVMRGR